MLDKCDPTHLLVRTVAACLLWLAISAGTAQAAVLELHRGVGLHEWLNWSPVNEDGSYRWPPYRSETEWLAGYRDIGDWADRDVFGAINAMGFDFVRLTVDPGPLLATSGARRDEALHLIGQAIARVTSSGLKVVLDLHGVRQVPQYGMDFVQGGADSEGVAAYQDMLEAIARLLVEIGTDRVALEPYNEPAYYPCTTDGTGDWQQIMATSVARIRSVSEDLTIVATGACGGSVAGLVDLDPRFDDDAIYYSFHMYEPHSFTHQGLGGDDDFLSGLPWPADRGTPERVIQHLLAKMGEAGLDVAQQTRILDVQLPVISAYFASGEGPAQLEQRFDTVGKWAARHGIPSRRLFMGEFGATLMSWDGRKGAFEADRSRYVEAVRRQAESRDIVWSIWEFSNPFGMSVIERDGPAVPDRRLLDALGLAGG